MFEIPTVIQGDSHTDSRGTIAFVNDFSFEGVTRFYTLHHPETSIIRAWQGHIKEAKYYFPVKGIWVIAWVKIDFTIDEKDWKAEYVIFKAEENKMLYIPPGYANGFKALEKDSYLNGFSVQNKESETLLRWDPHKWLDWDSIQYQ
jgi:dTDP-4-dehydrorhamnose 3,5-epimerase-like enzyme